MNIEYIKNPELGEEYYYVTPTQPIKVRKVVCSQVFGFVLENDHTSTQMRINKIRDLVTEEEMGYILLHGKTMLLKDLDTVVEVLTLIYNENPLREHGHVLYDIRTYLLALKKTNPECFL